MRIVIDLPDKVYGLLKYFKSVLDTDTDYKEEDDVRIALTKAVLRGTPLPKGHGRLIDADALKKYIDDCDCCVGCEDESYGCSYKCKCPDYLDKDMERIINNQPTIIEADTESEDKA